VIRPPAVPPLPKYIETQSGPPLYAMTTFRFISIDQNCLPLWDAVPKVHAAARPGVTGTHYAEDVDVAFTRRGGEPGDDLLEIARECIYRDGTSDWGAVLFYTEFLGRNPLDIRAVEPYTGLKTSALARRLNTTVEDLYRRWSDSDNWQLVGVSYVHDRTMHRVIGDLSVAEVKPYVLRLYDIAREDVARAFPSRPAQNRIAEWFTAETARIKALLREFDQGTLSDFYAASMRHSLPAHIEISCTSSLFELTPAAPDLRRLFLPFIERYSDLANVYNAAVKASNVGVAPVRISRGELPFYAVFRFRDRLVRSELVYDGETLRAGPLAWHVKSPDAALLERMRNDGVPAVVGKAILLVIQARLRAGNADLLLPEHGSLYMPAAFLLEKQLRDAGLLPRAFPCVRRVCFHFLRRMADVDERVVLPPYLARILGESESSSRMLGRQIDDVIAGARAQLDRLQEPSARERLMDDLFPQQRRRIRDLDRERRELVRDPSRRAEASALWDRMRELEREVLAGFVERIVDLVHVSRLDVWNSRGALIPWAYALGGEEFVERLLAQAEIVVDHG